MIVRLIQLLLTSAVAIALASDSVSALGGTIVAIAVLPLFLSSLLSLAAPVAAISASPLTSLLYQGVVIVVQCACVNACVYQLRWPTPSASYARPTRRCTFVHYHTVSQRDATA
jgi:hypothetical protein